MNLYIKQKIFSWTDKYKVYDEYGNLYFDVEAELLTMMPKFHLKDLTGRELFYIRKRFSFMVGEYEIYQGDRLCAAVHQQIRFFSPKLFVESEYGDFDIDGEFFGMDFTIRCNGNVIGAVHKKWMSWSDCYELEIPDSEHAAFFCALVIAIDNCLHNGNNG